MSLYSAVLHIARTEKVWPDENNSFTEDPSTPCNKLSVGNWFYVPKSCISLSCLIWKMLRVLRSNTIKLGNMVKFSTFFIAWWKILCCGPIFLEVIRQLNQEACSLPKQIRQPCSIFLPSQVVLIHFKVKMVSYWNGEKWKRDFLSLTTTFWHFKCLYI